MNRREFLKLLGVTPLLLSRAGTALGDALPAPWRRSVILVELAGGNDGLNTVVPWADSAYYRARPALAVPAGEVLRLSDGLGFHPSLEPLMAAWEGGELAVINGVGYPEPNRSHFRSIDIWETGSDAEETLESGWVCRCLAGQLPEDLTVEALVLGDAESGPVTGEGLRSLVLDRTEAFFDEARRLRSAPAVPSGRPAVDHLLAVQATILDAAAELESSLASAPPLRARFPSTPLGRQLELVAQLLAAGVPLPFIKVTQTGYDTHARQRARQDGLLEELALSIAALRDALVGCDRWGDAVVATYSEFGRRVAENGSGGTDHGTAAPQLVLGGQVSGGFFGAAPDLGALEDDDLRYAVDFRSVYGTLCDRWWGVESPFAATEFPQLAFL